MKVQLEEIKGEIVKDNDTYVLVDNNYLDHMTLSRTYLKPGQSTRGHSHDNQEEVYIFTAGEGTMIINDIKYPAQSGDTFLIKAGEFHRVINNSQFYTCAFTCIFETYDRTGDDAKYN